MSDNSEEVRGELGNGKDTVVLVGVDGRVVDFVDYKDDGDWPLAAGMHTHIHTHAHIHIHPHPHTHLYTHTHTHTHTHSHIHIHSH